MDTYKMKAFVRDDFRNLAEYRAWVNQKMETLSLKNRWHRDSFTLKQTQYRIIQEGPEWYGEGTTAEELLAGISQYSRPDLVEQLIGKVRDEIPRAVTNLIKVRKMDFNDRGMGLFSFDRAAMGLYRLKELYCPSLERVVEKEECHESDGRYTLIIDGSEVLERWEQMPDGRPKVRTTSKKVFAFFPRRNKEREAVEIYIACGGNSHLTAEQMLYSGLGAIVFAEILSKARIPTKITMAIGTSTDNWMSSLVSLIPVKNYDENLDSNLLATLSSDPRFFRFDGFRGIISTYDHFGKSCPWSLGACINQPMLMRCIEDSTYTKNAKLVSNRFYFGGTNTEEQAISQVNKAISTLSKVLNQ